MSKNGISMYDDFEKVKANHVPLSPLSFLPRAASFYPDKEAIVYGNRHYTWAQTYERCKRLASAINKLGVSKGETVSVMATKAAQKMCNSLDLQNFKYFSLSSTALLDKKFFVIFNK